MTAELPLFPLGTVLYPGLLLPLHVFEDRYRRLVSDLSAAAEAGRRFGVVAIREGREVGSAGARALHEVGCVARIRHVEPRDDGSYDLVTVGTERFRVDALDDSGPYLTASVEMLDEPSGEEASVLAAAVATMYGRYRSALLATQGRTATSPPDLPADPVALSYLVAAAAVLFVPDKQRLLAAPDAATRLRLERDLLRREVALLKRLPSLPAVELLHREVAAS